MILTVLTAAFLGTAGMESAKVEVIRGDEIATVAAAVQPVSLNPHAMDLVDSNTAIKQWAVRTYDVNRDGWLSLYEAQPAVKAFEEIADEDRDGHVTVKEYQAAVSFLQARY